MGKQGVLTLFEIPQEASGLQTPVRTILPIRPVQAKAPTRAGSGPNSMQAEGVCEGV